ncbi:permease [Salinicoccus sp. ID82-1]|uniref:permease n=1 Tax=Salinicoccus sp. ID82-1 TaxID=2820269 RepID=UPI001F2C828D|nr:permease [Salinicoccus sp. ID82-1]MCG1008956.1 permease [Salinicoccus sp. ID82-1]
MKSSKTAFMLLGVFFLIVTCLLGWIAFTTGSKPTLMFYTFISMSIMSFCMAHLYPQFIQKDERMRLIRQKAILASFFAMLLYLMVFTTITQFGLVSLPSVDLFQIFTALMISTAFISMVVYSKVY